ncbi:uncharacterized protein JCM6883_004726 [Sporobolomyces salmoneus]|uniref:uncharacterized protein n=1 Tax=Sporobolomyces salmoneus TaxID=183962 RepID=UPI003182AF49
MVSTRTLFSALTLLGAALTSSAQLLDLDLDLGLLQDGALVTADVFADALTETSCPDGNIGIVANVLDLVRVCGCVSLLNLAPGQSVCPECPTGSSAICGRGNCACACDEGAVADSTTGTCLPEDDCTNSGGSLQSNEDGTFVCVCAAPGLSLSTTTGACVLAPSAAARRNRRNFVFNTPSYPFTSGGNSAKFCPENETACPNGNSFECVDTRDSLTACGGCPGQGGEDCLEIPGALNVQCSNSKCRVASCFAGYTLSHGRCI